MFAIVTDIATRFTIAKSLRVLVISTTILCHVVALFPIAENRARLFLVGYLGHLRSSLVSQNRQCVLSTYPVWPFISYDTSTFCSYENTRETCFAHVSLCRFPSLLQFCTFNIHLPYLCFFAYVLYFIMETYSVATVCCFDRVRGFDYFFCEQFMFGLFVLLRNGIFGFEKALLHIVLQYCSKRANNFFNLSLSKTVCVLSGN